MSEDRLKSYIRYLKTKKNPAFADIFSSAPLSNPNAPVDPGAVDSQLELRTKYVSGLRRILNDARSGAEGDIGKLSARADKTIDRYLKSSYFVGKQAMTGEKELKRPGDRHQKIPNIPTARDKEMLDKMIRRESKYFKNFLVDYNLAPDNIKIKDKKTGEMKTPRELAGKMDYDRRLALYKGPLDGAFRHGVVSGVLDGIDEDAKIYWELSAHCKNCPSCIILALGSPYTKDTLKTVPGGGDTLCGSSCKCKLRFVSKRTGEDLMATDSDTESPYIYDSKVPPAVKEAIDEKGNAINYYRQMIDLADTQEQRDFYIEQRRAATKEAIALRKENKVRMAPRYAVDSELVPSATSLRNHYQPVQHENKQFLQNNKRVGVLKGTNYRVGILANNDGKDSLLISFGKDVKSFKYDEAVIYDNADILGQKISEKAINDVRIAAENQETIVRVAEMFKNSVPQTSRTDDFETLSLLGQYYIDKHTLDSMYAFGKLDYNATNLSILKAFLASDSNFKLVTKESLIFSFFIPKVKYGLNKILQKSAATGITNIPSLSAETTANLINFEKALVNMPIYANDTVYRIGATSKESLNKLHDFIIKQDVLRNPAFIKGRPIGYSDPLATEFQVQYNITSAKGRIAGAALRERGDELYDIYFGRGSLFKVGDVEFSNDKILKVYLEELLSDRAQDYVKVSSLGDLF